MFKTKLWLYDSTPVTGNNKLRPISDNIKFSVSSGNFSLNSTVISGGWNYHITKIKLNAGTYTISPIPVNNSMDTYFPEICISPNYNELGAGVLGYCYVISGQTKTFTLTETKTLYIHYRQQIITATTGWSFKFMLNTGSSALPYEAYKEYESDYKGTELTQYVLQGNQNAEDITNELESAEVTLQGYPYQKEFTPETKLIMEKVVETVLSDGTTTTDVLTTLHWCVDTDTVTKPILNDNNYYNHTISLIEPSVVAQKRLVDNISSTYRLKFVDLKELTTFSTEELIKPISSETQFTPIDNFGYTHSSTWYQDSYTYRSGKYFKFNGELQIQEIGQTATKKKYLKFNVGETSKSVKFLLPDIDIYFGNENTKTFTNIGHATIDYSIKQYSPSNPSVVEQEWTGTRKRGADFSTGNVTRYVFNDTPTSETLKYWLPEYRAFERITVTRPPYGKTIVYIPRTYIRQYSESGSADTNETDTITMLPEKVYTITVSLHTYNNPIPSGNPVSYDGINYFVRYTDSPIKTANLNYSQNLVQQILTGEFSVGSNNIKIENSGTTMSAEMQTYSDTSTKLLYTSATPYSALSLIQKAIVNSGVYEKVNGAYIGDTNATSDGSLWEYFLSQYPFYVDPNFVDELLKTQVIENFYNQKNLWEVLVEAGNYIHAIPEIKFGKDDKFMITFNRLGETTQYEDKATKSSIMNFKGVDDYICATSSYVANMVQLGGQIVEYTAPKASISDNYLIYNDTANITVSKPIIEILSVVAKCNLTQTLTWTFHETKYINAGTTADMTQFIYEKNVYDVIGVNPLNYPNKGVAMYYELGSNSILGGDYRTPSVNSGDAINDYAFKKILYSAWFGYPSGGDITSGIPYWNYINVNNFSFIVTYRTKDSIRQDQSRPDLRKYLLSSRYDSVPQHNQFNNQEDILVDSHKFGMKNFGVLMRTGNTNYTINEWNDDYNNVKHKGQLYEINSELYYVAKVTHTWYTDHIESTVEYSKDYNQLSQVIGIPSEPRFYEISEQSSINREVSIDDYLIITDDTNKLSDEGGSYVKDISFPSKLILGFSISQTPQFAITTFKSDKDIDNVQLGSVTDFYKEIVKPLNIASSGNTLTFSWEMVDNFGAGDSVDTNSTLPSDGSHGGLRPTVDNVYRTMQAVGYTDIFGRADLFDFYIAYNPNVLTESQINSLPSNTIPNANFNIFMTNAPTTKSGSLYKKSDTSATADIHTRGLSLLKDCRESLGFNYNLQLLTTSDTFVVSPFVFNTNKNGTNYYFVLLNKEINKFSDGYINASDIIRPKMGNDSLNDRFLEYTYYSMYNQISFTTALSTTNVNEKHFTDDNDYERIKAIAIVYDVPTDINTTNDYKVKFTIGRNIPSNWTRADAIKSWYIGTVNKDTVFTNRQ